MKRFEKYGDVILRGLTSPLRALIGLGICVKKNMQTTNIAPNME